MLISDTLFNMFSIIEYIITNILFELSLIPLLLGGICIFLDNKYRDTFHRCIFFYGLSFCLMGMENIVIDENIIKQIQNSDPVNSLFFRLFYIFMVGVTVWCFLKTDWSKLK
jgi:hypothetical protein